MTSDKYELIPYIEGLSRIRALRDFGDVRAGDLGGIVQSEDSLSHRGDCWIYDYASVIESARVQGDAKIRGYAYITENATISGNAVVSENVVVRGKVKVSTGAIISGKCILSGDIVVNSPCSVVPEVIVTNRYMVVITDHHISIGCETHTLDKWKTFSNRRIGAMDRGALEWWKEYRDVVLGLAEIHQRKLTIEVDCPRYAD